MHSENLSKQKKAISGRGEVRQMEKWLQLVGACGYGEVPTVQVGPEGKVGSG